MARRKIAAGATSVMLPIFVPDPSSSSGAGLAGLSYATAGVGAAYRREGSSTWTTINLASAVVGTFTSGGFIDDGGQVPGGYELGVPDAALALGARWVEIEIYGTETVFGVIIEIELDQPPSTVIQVGAAAAGAASTITIQTALGADNLINGGYVEIVRGTGAGQNRVVTGYVNSTKIITVGRPWTVVPDTTSIYVLRFGSAPAIDVSLNVKAALADNVIHGGPTALLQFGSSGASPPIFIQNHGSAPYAVRIDTDSVAGAVGLSVRGGKSGGDGVQFIAGSGGQAFRLLNSDSTVGGLIGNLYGDLLGKILGGGTGILIGPGVLVANSSGWTLEQMADALLTRDWGHIVGSAPKYCLLNAGRFWAGNWTTDKDTLIVYQEDGSTEAWRARLFRSGVVGPAGGMSRL